MVALDGISERQQALGSWTLSAEPDLAPLATAADNRHLSETPAVGRASGTTLVSAGPSSLNVPNNVPDTPHKLQNWWFLVDAFLPHVLF